MKSADCWRVLQSGVGLYLSGRNLWLIAANQALNCVWKRRSDRRKRCSMPRALSNQSGRPSLEVNGNKPSPWQVFPYSRSVPPKHRVSHPVGRMGGGGGGGGGCSSSLLSLEPHLLSFLSASSSSNGCRAPSSAQPRLDKTWQSVGCAHTQHNTTSPDARRDTL